MSLAARTGIADIPPARWIDRNQNPPPSWGQLHAYEDLLEGAADRVAGNDDEARAAFRRGLARDPFDPSTLRYAATLRAALSFDLDAAEADARRAASLDRRQGKSRPIDSDPTILRVLAARSKAPSPPAPRSPDSPDDPDSGD